MAKNGKVRIAVIGIGNMGSSHVYDSAHLDETELVAVCDIDHARADQAAAQYQVKAFYDYRDLLSGAELDAVIIATPHYDHTPISIDCLKRGIHVLVEKPLAVHVNDGNRMIAAYEEARQRYPSLVFAIMFQQRTQGFWRKVKQLIEQGELGRLARATWIITDWFRTQFYYDHGGWRATWKGEGGGVLLNQCPHNLDLYQWFFGMPKRITGFASIGKYHHIEVEDEVTAFFEHENGMVGHFITTTAESPGTNRLEIAGELGKLVFEDGRLSFSRNRSSMFEFIKTSSAAFDRVDFQTEDIPYEGQEQPGHTQVIATFARAILKGEPLIVNAVEGINSLAIGNGIMLSHFLGRPVELPLDGDRYEAILQDLIQKSTFHKEAREGTFGDLSKSFGIYR